MSKEDDVLNDLPIDTPKKAKKKNRNMSAAPVEEIDALPQQTEQTEVAPPEAVSPPEAAPPEYVEEEVPSGHDFDSLPTAPPVVEQTPWEKFLGELPADLTRTLLDSGIFTLELLVVQCPLSLTLPVGKFTAREVQQLQACMASYGWRLAENSEELLESPRMFADDTVVQSCVVHVEPADFQKQRSAQLRGLLRSM